MKTNDSGSTGLPSIKVNKKVIAELSTINDLAGRLNAANWMANQGEEIKLEIFAKHGELIRQRRVPGESITPEFSYSMFLLASKLVRINEESLAHKRELSILQTEDLARKRAEGFLKPKRKKGSKKLSQIRKQFFAMIKVLKETHNYSWSEVVAYLQNYHQFIVSRAYIQQAYRQLQKEADENEQLTQP